jgi:hypothetical protein
MRGMQSRGWAGGPADDNQVFGKQADAAPGHLTGVGNLQQRQHQAGL